MDFNLHCVREAYIARQSSILTRSIIICAHT